MFVSVLAVTAAGEKDERQDDEPNALVIEKTAKTVIHSITYFHMENPFHKLRGFPLCYNTMSNIVFW